MWSKHWFIKLIFHIDLSTCTAQLSIQAGKRDPGTWGWKSVSWTFHCVSNPSADIARSTALDGYMGRVHSESGRGSCYLLLLGPTLSPLVPLTVRLLPELEVILLHHLFPIIWNKVSRHQLQSTGREVAPLTSIYKLPPLTTKTLLSAVATKSVSLKAPSILSFLKIILLQFNCFTVLCWFPLQNKVDQSHARIYSLLIELPLIHVRVFL